MEKTVKRLFEAAVVPVVKLERAEDAVPLAAALKRGGLCCAEITFRTDAAPEAIRRISEAFPELVLGAGTVLTCEQADSAIRAGAGFIVSPGLNPRVVSHCLERGYPVIPGVCTPSEVEQGLSLGLTHLKFFPAEAAGGVKMIKALSAPYGQVRFMPTGGISAGNLKSYLSCGSVFACGGSWMVAPETIASGRFGEIERLTAEAVEIAKEARAK